jgi:glycosyltransferase involved in cell wall biosynthesis
MLNGKSIIAVIPAYNVQDQIKVAVEGVHHFVDNIIVVDDCSTDNTEGVVEQIPDRRIILLRNGKNRGVGGATIEGFRKGLEIGGDIFVKYDGDGQMDPEKMEELISPLFNNYDYVKANRFIHSKELGRMQHYIDRKFPLTFQQNLRLGIGIFSIHRTARSNY